MNQPCFKLSSEATCSAEIVEEHVNYLRDVARTEPPKKLELLLQLLEMSDDEKIDAPRKSFSHACFISNPISAIVTSSSCDPKR